MMLCCISILLQIWIIIESHSIVNFSHFVVIIDLVTDVACRIPCRHIVGEQEHLVLADCILLLLGFVQGHGDHLWRRLSSMLLVLLMSILGIFGTYVLFLHA